MVGCNNARISFVPPFCRAILLVQSWLWEAVSLYCCTTSQHSPWWFGLVPQPWMCCIAILVKMLVYGLAGCPVLVVHAIFGLEQVHLCVMGCFNIAVVLGPTCSRLGTVHAMLIKWSFHGLHRSFGLSILWGYVGDEVTCSKPHCFAKLLEGLGCELWALVSPYFVWGTSVTT